MMIWTYEKHVLDLTVSSSFSVAPTSTYPLAFYNGSVAFQWLYDSGFKPFNLQCKGLVRRLKQATSCV